MDVSARFDEQQRQHGYGGLIGLIVGMALGGAALYALAGPPRLPSELPSWELILITLQGSSVPYEALAYILTTAAWAVWFWIVASLLLRLVVVSADTLSHGAAWLGPFRTLSDRVTLPIVRRLVDGAIVAIIVVNLVSRPAPSAAAAPLPPAYTVAVAAFHHDEDGAPGLHPADVEPEQEARAVEYTVQQGDTLWAIAERFYGTGYEYPRLVKANAGRLMPDGRQFTQAGVIHPGWILMIPLPSHAVEEAHGRLHNIVEEGDTLRGIAARLLGNESRWPEIFELNRGTARLGDGRVFKDPDLIWPGLRLGLPLPSERAEEPPRTREPEASVPEEPAAIASPDPSVTPEPTATPAASTAAEVLPSEPTPILPPAASLTPAVAVEPEPPSADGATSPLVYGAAGLAAAAAAGGAALLIRRRARRSLSEPPIPREPSPPPSDDFAEAEFSRALAHQLHGGEVEPLTRIAGQALRFLAEQGVDDVSVVMARQGRKATTLTLGAILVAQTRILECAGAFAACLGGKGLASLTPDHDVALLVASPKLAGLLTPSDDPRAHALCLLPLGVLPSGETFYASWQELGHVLIAGLPGGGTDVILTSVMSALTARRRPQELGVWLLASRRSLPAQLWSLPHQAGFADPDDENEVCALLDQVRAELLRRMRSADQDDAERPASGKEREFVLVVGDLRELKDEGAFLELLGLHGPAHGVRLLAATTDPPALGEEVLAHFGTRLVLQTLDDQESIQLLGQPDAADLGSGDLLIRVDGRLPVRAQGFRVSPDHLDELLRLMREAYGGNPSSIGPTVNDSDAEESDSLAASGAERDTPGDQVSAAGDEVYVPPEPGVDAVEEILPSAGLSEEARPENEPMASTAGQDEEDQEREAVISQRVSVEGSPGQGLASDGHQRTVTADRIGTAAISEPYQPTLLDDGVPSNGHEVASPSPDAVAVADGTAIEQTSPGATSLVQVMCFGAFEVRSGDGEITPSLEDRSAHRSFELLAFLAVQPEGTVSKDKLLAALWPDSDDERASKSMGVTMVRLRAVLARHVPGLTPNAVRCDRNGTCHLDREMIWSDAREFLALCRSAPKLPLEEATAALRQALALYRGDLLAGQATRLYRWVDDRTDTGVSLRDAYREEYNRAVLRLARLYYRDGQAAEALPLLKRLLQAEPTLEDVVRDVYRCYQQLGDLSSLVREDRHLRQALQEAYYDPDDPNDDPDNYQPEPETIALFNKIREELEARAAARAGDGGRKAAGNG